MAREGRKVYSQRAASVHHDEIAVPTFPLSTEQEREAVWEWFQTSPWKSSFSPFYLCNKTSAFTGVSKPTFPKQTIFPGITRFLSNSFPSSYFIYFQEISAGFKVQPGNVKRQYFIFISQHYSPQLTRDIALANYMRRRTELHPVSYLFYHLQYLCSVLRLIPYLHKNMKTT